jgi:hypothetical protein
MSKKDLTFLKKTLSDIENIDEEIRTPLEEKENLETKVENALTSLNDAKFSLAEAEPLKHSHDEWMIDREKDHNHAEKFKIKAQKELDEHKNDIELMNDEENQIKDLNLKIENLSSILFIGWGAIIVFIIIGIFAGYNQAQELPRGEWVCDDGEIIELLDVLDDTEHCFDGSDENKGGWFTDSRAEKAEDSEEYNELLDAKWWKWEYVTFYYSIAGISILFWASGIKYLRTEIVMHTLDEVESSYYDKKSKIGKIKSRIDKWNRKINSNRKQIHERSVIVNSIPSIINKIKQCEKNLESVKSEQEFNEKQIKDIRQKEQELWESIRHLIPFGSLVK